MVKTFIGIIYWLVISALIGLALYTYEPIMLTKISPKTSDNGFFVLILVGIQLFIAFVVPVLAAKIADVLGIWYIKENKLNIFLRLFLGAVCGVLTGSALVPVVKMWLNGRYLGPFDGFMYSFCALVIGIAFMAAVVSDEYPGNSGTKR